MLSVLYISNHLRKDVIQKYLDSGYFVEPISQSNCINYLHTTNPRDLLIVDLDNITIKDSESFKEFLALMGKRIMIVCSKSLSRLNYYKDFDTYSSFENLLVREFYEPNS